MSLKGSFQHSIILMFEMISCGARPGEGWLLGHSQRALGSGYHSGLGNQKTKRGWIGCIETKISRKKHEEFDAESCRG